MNDAGMLTMKSGMATQTILSSIEEDNMFLITVHMESVFRERISALKTASGQSRYMRHGVFILIKIRIHSFSRVRLPVDGWIRILFRWYYTKNGINLLLVDAGV
jgi:hypothetical protein